MITGWDEIYEDDGCGGVSSLQGWLLYGDVDDRDIELFLGDYDVEDAFPDGGDWDIFPDTYVRKVPRENGHAYVYANGPGRGARKCVRLERHSSWNRWCVNHIYEPASTGVPVSQVSDPPWPLVLDGYVYLCRPCSASFHERRDAAIKAALTERRPTDD